MKIKSILNSAGGDDTSLDIYSRVDFREKRITYACLSFREKEKYKYFIICLTLGCLVQYFI